MWSEKREGITSFRVDPTATPEDWLVDVLDQIDLHHGEYSQSPPYSALQIVGTAFSRFLDVFKPGWNAAALIASMKCLKDCLSGNA